MPSPSEQVRAARETVLLVPAPDLAVVTITGDDRKTWLNGLVTCDVKKLESGAAMYGLAVTQKGRISSDLFVLECGDAIQLVLAARAVESVMAAFDHYLVMEDAEMARDESRCVWLAHGPKSADLVRRVRADGDLGGYACDMTGLGGALFVAPAEEKDRLGRKVGELGGAVGDDDGWEALRLERGVPEFGADFDEKTYPQEASLEKRAVSFDKGCYLGQEVVCMLEMRGHVKRKLVPFVAEGDASLAPGAAVTDEAGADVGKISSAAVSPTLGKTVGLAMVKLANAAPGTRLHAPGAALHIVERPV